MGAIRKSIYWLIPIHSKVMSSGVNYIFGNTPATGYAMTQAVDPKFLGKQQLLPT